MIQLVPQLRILLACQPVDFRCGIDGLAAICKREFAEDHFDLQAREPQHLTERSLLKQ
jgi:hypothetical protein